ncbi:Zinc finger protein 791 [Heterocephalus glaber]|uniref:Zinc finger protein 791 n=1 Tax=Heterocephalus glaber TaxID=10181 RepID=G5AYK3_HETGA|nr:Zinc finger protein 791 [Heterocephalus glaber]
MEEWVLLNPSQKKLYRDVMEETFRNIVAIGRAWDNQEVEEDYKNYWRNLRNEEVEKCFQNKGWNQFEEIFLCTPDANVDKKQAGLTPAESLACKKPPIGHLSLNVPIIAHTGLNTSDLGLEEMYKCNEHGKTYDFQSFQKDAKTKTGEKPYEYDQCGKSYPDINESIHLREKTFVYKKNLKATSTYSDVQIHERNHNGGKLYVCMQCGKAFNTQGIHTGEKPYVCKQCGKAFTQDYCKIHERIHTGEKPYVCKQCGKAFNTQYYCKIHERIHTGEKPYVCRQCGKAFVIRGYCKRHERIHTGEKPYVCKQCGKAFTKRGYCKTHERIHTGEKPYVCMQCGKAFSTHDDCQRHESTHSQEKPYVCKQCGKAFLTPSKCQRHERIHTGEKPYICKQCGKAFNTASGCKKHERTHTRH